MEKSLEDNNMEDHSTIGFGTEFITNKIKEVRGIRKDLEFLLDRLKTIKAENQIEGVRNLSNIPNSLDYEMGEEKHDDVSEKALIGHNELISKQYDDFQEESGDVNWSVVAPIIQKHVSDLKELHALNSLVDSVERRILNIDNNETTSLDDIDP